MKRISDDGWTYITLFLVVISLAAFINYLLSIQRQGRASRVYATSVCASSPPHQYNDCYVGARNKYYGSTTR